MCLVDTPVGFGEVLVLLVGPSCICTGRPYRHALCSPSGPPCMDAFSFFSRKPFEFKRNGLEKTKNCFNTSQAGCITGSDLKNFCIFITLEPGARNPTRRAVRITNATQRNPIHNVLQYAVTRFFLSPKIPPSQTTN